MKIMYKLGIFWLTTSSCNESDLSQEKTERARFVVKKEDSVPEQNSNSASIQPNQSMRQFHLFYTHIENLRTGSGPLLQKVTRTNKNVITPQFVLDELYNGPLPSEKGIRFTTCGTTGAKLTSIEQGNATVQLEGSCGGCGTHSIYDLINATLLEFSDISTVTLLDANGRTEGGRPSCLQP